MRKRYSDTGNVGRSKLVPYIPGEDPGHRHHRRKTAAEEMGETVKAYTEGSGWSLVIANQGHHWKFTHAGGLLAEWWPSSAKLVFNRKYDRGSHCHDAEQLIRELKKQCGRAFDQEEMTDGR